MSEIVAFVALIISFLVAVYLFVLLLIVKAKKILPVPFTQFLSLVIVGAGIVFTFVDGSSILPLALVILLENLLLIPHYTVMKNIDKIDLEKNTEQDEVSETDIIEETVVPEVQEPENQDESFLETNLSFITQSAEAFTAEAGLARLLDTINNGIIKEVKADGGAVLLIDDFDDVIAVKAFAGEFPPPYELPSDVPHKIVRVETNFRFAQFPLKDTIFGSIATAGKPELVVDPLSDTRFFQNTPEDFLRLGSYIFVPLRLKDTVIGLIALARNFEHPAFTEADFKKAQLITEFACVAIKNVYTFQEVVEHAELTREAQIAGKLQLNLHPQLLPAIPGLSLGSFFNTSEGVCGDCYDVLPSRVDRISFSVADVAGKGMNSLIIMVMIKAILRLVVNTSQSAATILSWVNRGIAQEKSIDHFASLALVNYDTTTKKVQYATAGTTPILLYSAANDELKTINQVTEPLGVEKTTVYTDTELDVESGDIIIMYSDGIPESTNSKGKQYSAARLEKLIKENHSLSGKEIANVVKSDISQFCGAAHQHDDQTILVIKIL